jgi:hypothetical protein
VKANREDRHFAARRWSLAEIVAIVENRPRDAAKCPFFAALLRECLSFESRSKRLSLPVTNVTRRRVDENRPQEPMSRITASRQFFYGVPTFSIDRGLRRNLEAAGN